MKERVRYKINLVWELPCKCLKKNFFFFIATLADDKDKHQKKRKRGWSARKTVFVIGKFRNLIFFSRKTHDWSPRSSRYCFQFSYRLLYLTL